MYASSLKALHFSSAAPRAGSAQKGGLFYQLAFGSPLDHVSEQKELRATVFMPPFCSVLTAFSRLLALGPLQRLWALSALGGISAPIS